MTFINNFLTLYTWTIFCLLILFLMGIARFYERKAEQRSFYGLFSLPIMAFIIATIRYISLGTGMTGDGWGDILRGLGGLVLTGLSIFIFQLMVGKRT